mmetsp:Transcript_11684/g.22387  ORF Transcript_11684/g.22387 Transcript_11684/m.22387 type:complete len:268 (+) Transcript_11684:122-925(+)
MTTQSSSSSCVESTTTTPSNKTTTATSSLMRPDRKVIYVNLVVLDATDAIDQQLQREFKDIPKPLHNVACGLAAAWATPERVAEAMAIDVPKNLVAKMADKGLTTVAETTFIEGPFLVVQVQILSVSPAAMVEAQSKDFYDEFGDLEEKAHMSQALALRLKHCIQSVLDWFGVKNKKSLESDYLPRLIQSKMESIMDEAVAGKLKQRGLHAISKVLIQEKQARYFFDTLRQVREAHRPFANITGAFALSHENDEQQPLVDGAEKKVV